jgi:uncharacterized membrane protein
VIGLFTGIIIGLFYLPFLMLTGASILIYILAVFIDSFIQNKQFNVAVLSIVTALVLLIAYGLGVLRNIVVRMILKKGTDSQKSVLLKK